MAKIFTTNGTGASQTLDEASSNRLKVYDDFDSIDKTALADGEIVSTKENGVGGNVYDYVEEQIADAQSYSTEETLTGGTWIDGKPIYRKVTELVERSFPYHQLTPIYDLSGQDIDTLINWEEIQYPITGSTTIDIYYFKTGAFEAHMSKDNNAFAIDAYQSFTGGSTVIKAYRLVLVYTKTTD